MDNKKWGKRFSTIFWWSLTILPFVIPLIQFIGYHLTFNSGIASASDLASYHDNNIGNYLYFLKSTCGYGMTNSFYYYSIPALRTMFNNLFVSIGFESGIAVLLSSVFGWMSSVFFFHVIFDVSVWIFRMLHSWLDRWCCE